MDTLFYKIILVIFIILISNTCNCQNLSFIDLKYIFEHNIEECDTYVYKKGFKYDIAEKGTDGNCDAITWSFNRDTSNSHALSYLTKTCTMANTGSIFYYLTNRNNFEKIKFSCKSNGFQFSKSVIDSSIGLSSVFVNAKYTVGFCSRLSDNLQENTYIIVFGLKSKQNYN